MGYQAQALKQTSLEAAVSFCGPALDPNLQGRPATTREIAATTGLYLDQIPCRVHKLGALPGISRPVGAGIKSANVTD